MDIITLTLSKKYANQLATAGIKSVTTEEVTTSEGVKETWIVAVYKTNPETTIRYKLPAFNGRGITNTELVETSEGLFLKLTFTDGTTWTSSQSIKGEDGSQVVANVPITGSEPELLSLQIDGVKYQNLNYHPFPEEFKTTDDFTFEEFGQSVVEYSGFATGCVWFGGIECTELPSNMRQCECKVTAIRDESDPHSPGNIAIIELFSSEVAPFYWHYNTDSYSKGSGKRELKYTASIDGSKLDTSATSDDRYNVRVKKGSWNGWEFYTEKVTSELPAYPADTTKTYILGLKYENGAWVKHWAVASNPTADIVGVGQVDYMTINS